MTRDPSAPEPLVTSAENTALRALLEAGRDELPSAAQLDSLASKLGPILGPGGPGGGHGGGGGAPVAAAARTATGAAIAKALGAATLAIVLGVTALHAVRNRAQTSSPTTVQAPTAAPPAPPAASAPLPDDAPLTAPVSPPVAPRPSAPHSSARPSTSTPAAAEDPDAEVKLLQVAQASLQSDPGKTLALCAEHARRFPNGLMAQEREVLAIEALAQTGHTDEARARADRFAASYPSSTHLRRIHTVLGDAP